jgi:hypothetical protein
MQGSNPHAQGEPNLHVTLEWCARSSEHMFKVDYTHSFVWVLNMLVHTVVLCYFFSYKMSQKRKVCVVRPSWNHEHYFKYFYVDLSFRIKYVHWILRVVFLRSKLGML